MSNGSSDAPNWQNDPFGEDFFLIPYPEELRVRAQQLRQDNQDAVHLYVELVLWGMRDRPDLVRVMIALLWLWEDIVTEWLAEACDTSIRNICEIAEAESPLTFNCLDCGVELPTEDRQHVIDLYRSYKTFHKGQNQGTPRALLCVGCTRRRDKDDTQQRTLDQRRYRAIIRNVRKGSYGERRTSDEWRILKKQVHSRDDYRCRMCNRDDLPLHVHHRTYKTYAEERLADLITLCAKCHGLFHSLSEVS
jgi:5-methylcytosine-specific restriction endonuclease McrA